MAMELNKDILRVGQQWERADGSTATVLCVEESGAYIGCPRSGNGIWYRYCDGGKSNVHSMFPQTQLVKLLLDRNETTKAPLNESEGDAAPIGQEIGAQEQNIKVQEQDVTVVSRFSNSVHNYPPLGHAVVYINSLQIEVDFGKRKLTVEDNAGPTYATPAPIAARNYEPLSNL